MSLYRFGDQCLDTAFAFTALRPWPGSASADCIRIAAADPAGTAAAPAEWLHQWTNPDQSIHLSMARTATGYWLHSPRLCDFVIDAGRRRIELIAAPGLDADTLEHLLVDQILPRYLAARGDLVLHAAALRIEGRAVLFLGESGWGKSTLSGLLAGSGFDLLSDDCMLLRPEAQQLLAIPTYPSLRLFGDSIAALGNQGDETGAVAYYTDKRRLRASDRIDEAGQAGMPVAALYLLVDPRVGSGRHEIKPLAPAAACMSLVQHGFQMDMKDMMQIRGRLAQASAATALVPAFTLDYPRDYASAGQLVGMVLEHLRSLDGHAAEAGAAASTRGQA